MAVSAGTAFVDIAPKLDKFGSSLTSGIAAAFGKLGRLPGLDKLESKLTSLGGGIGRSLTKLVTVPFLAIGAAAVASALDVEHAQFTIRRRTGETGAALKGLEEDFAAVGKQTGASFGTIADVLSTVHQRLGLVGDPLQTLTLTILRLQKVTGDAAPSVQDITKLFAQWNVKTDDQVKTLDFLYRASEKSGLGVGDLSGVLVRFAPQLKTVGFSLDTATALLGTLSKAGIDASQVMSGLRAFFGKVAKAGEDPVKAFRDVIEKIQQLGKQGKETAALKLGVQLFGSRGVGMVRAALDGKLAYQDFLDTVKNGKDTIAAANKQTLSFGDQFKVFKNQAVLALAPLGEKLFPVIQKAMSALLPALTSFLTALGHLSGPLLAVITAFALLGPTLGILTRLVGGAMRIFEGLRIVFLNLRVAVALGFGPLLLLGAILIGIVVIVIKFHKQLVAGFQRLWHDIIGIWNAIWDNLLEPIGRAFGDVINFLKKWGTLILVPILGPLPFIIQHWKATAALITRIWNDVWKVLGPVVKVALAIIMPIIKVAVALIVGTFRTGWAIVHAIFRAAFATIMGILRVGFSVIYPFIKFGFQLVASIVESAWNVIKNVIKLALAVIVPVVRLGMQAIWFAIKAVWDVIKFNVKLDIAIIKGIIVAGIWLWSHVIGPPLKLIKDTIFGAWNWIKKNVFPVVTWITSHIISTFKTVASTLSTIWDGIKSVASTAWNGIWLVIKGVINFIIEGVNGFIHGINVMIHGLNAVATPLHLIGVKSLPTIGTIPKLDTGGEVLKTGLAIVHRGETFSGVGGAGMGNVTVNVYGSVTTERQLVERIREALAGTRRRNVSAELS